MPNSSSYKKNFCEIAFADFERLASNKNFLFLNDRTIFITGATGFFGAWILSFIYWLRINKNINCKIIALSRNPTAFEEKHTCMKNQGWITWIKGDICDFDYPKDHIDYIIHAATDTSSAAAENPNTLLNSIIHGTENILAYAKISNPKRILLISSGAVYGVQPEQTKKLSELDLIAPSTQLRSSVYGEGKRIMELLGSLYLKQNTTNIIIARCFAFIGPGLPLDKHFAIGNFIQDALFSDSIHIKGDGSAIRSYLYAADLVLWLITLLQSGKNSTIYNVGSDEEITMKELANTILQILAPTKKVFIEGSSKKSPVGNRYIPSIDRAKKELALDVWTKLPDAIRLTAQWSMTK